MTNDEIAGFEEAIETIIFGAYRVIGYDPTEDSMRNSLRKDHLFARLVFPNLCEDEFVAIYGLYLSRSTIKGLLAAPEWHQKQKEQWIREAETSYMAAKEEARKLQVESKLTPIQKAYFQSLLDWSY